MLFLPDVSRLPTVRSKMADGVFVALSLCSRIFLLAGAVAGARLQGFRGFCIGLAAGAIIGFWIRRSLGLRGRNLTRGYHLRMFERGSGKAAGLLETLVELLRGNRLTTMQCRQIGSAYAEAARQLQSCDSAQERASIVGKRNRQVLEIAYGQSAMTGHGQVTGPTHELSESAAIGESAE
jgi:hypothetical protein